MAYMFDHHPNGHPVWDFLSTLEQHPFFAHIPPTGPHGHPAEQGASTSAAPETSSSSEQPKAQAEQAGVSSASGTRGPGENTAEKENERQPRQGSGSDCGCHGRRGRGGFHHGMRRGRPGFEGGPDPFPWARGRGGFGGRGGRPFVGRGRPHHRHGPHSGGPGFDVPAFLQRFGSRFGIDLSDIARELSAQSNDQIDFIPRADVFDLPTEFIVHVSLPGAQKPDISVDYDVDDNVLRLAGVVYRPHLDEELHNALTINEREREVGVFERKVKLGTSEAPARVEVDAITAKLEDGILVVRIPKVKLESETLKKKISIETVDTKKGKEKEKEVLVDLDGDVNTQSETGKHASVMDAPDQSDKMNVDSETEGGDHDLHDDDNDAPPQYHPGRYTPSVESAEADDDTTEYVKVNVE